MRPVRIGDRGAAVEDIQRRLRTLGYELGITGIDGVFFGLTAEAVRAFQQEHGLAEDGLVGDETWSALVDATFTLGDRMLYLRLPYFHGHDVALRQEIADRGDADVRCRGFDRPEGREREPRRDFRPAHDAERVFH